MFGFTMFMFIFLFRRHFVLFIAKFALKVFVCSSTSVQCQPRSKQWVPEEIWWGQVHTAWILPGQAAIDGSPAVHEACISAALENRMLIGI